MTMRYVTALIVALYVVFAYYIAQPEFYLKIADFNRLDWVAILFVPVSIIVVKYLSKFLREGRLNNRDIFWVFVSLSTISLLSIIIFYVKTETATAIVIGAYFASLGWIYTNYVNTNIQRKAHTMNVLVQLRNSTEFARARSVVLAKYPLGGKHVTADDLPALKAERSDGASYDNGALPLLDAAYYVVNYFEFISVGCMNHDLDPAMIENTLSSIMVNWFEHLEPIVRDAKNEPSGQENPLILSNYIEMVKYFKRKLGR